MGSIWHCLLIHICARASQLVLTPCHDEGFPNPSQNKDVSEVGWSNHMPEKLCHNHQLGGSKLNLYKALKKKTANFLQQK